MPHHLLVGNGITITLHYNNSGDLHADIEDYFDNESDG
jgi:hypothetical protein